MEHVRITAPARRDQVLAYVIEVIVRDGVSPTYDEIGKQLGFSKARAQELVAELERRGLVARTPGVQRGIRVLDVSASRHCLVEAMRKLHWSAADPLGELVGLPQVQMPIVAILDHVPDGLTGDIHA